MEVLFLILMVLVIIPILLLMPNDKNCNACNKELNVNRQKTYHRLLNGEDKEVCKQCYGSKAIKSSFTESKKTNEKLTQSYKHNKLKKHSPTKEGSKSTSLKKTNITNNNSRIKITTRIVNSGERNATIKPLIESPVNHIEYDDLNYENLIFLDTETIGLENPQIIELTILDHQKRILLNTLIKTSYPIEASAFSIHGISSDMLLHAPQIQDVELMLEPILKGKIICAYNIEFDLRALTATFGRKFSNPCFCVMLYAQKTLRTARWPRLDELRIKETSEVRPSHRALTDCEDTIDLFNLLRKTFNSDNYLNGFKEINIVNLMKVPDGIQLKYKRVFNSKLGGDLYFNDLYIAAISIHKFRQMIKVPAVNFYIEWFQNLPNIKLKKISSSYYNNQQKKIAAIKDRLLELDFLKWDVPKKKSLTISISAHFLNNPNSFLDSKKVWLESSGLQELSPSIIIKNEQGTQLGEIKNLSAPLKRIYSIGCLGYKQHIDLSDVDTNSFPIKVLVYQELSEFLSYSFEKNNYKEDIQYKDI